MPILRHVDGTAGVIAVSDIQAVVADHVEEIEQRRRLPAAVVDCLRRSGVFRLAIPRELGGLEAPVTDTVAAIAAIAAIDGSVGWCAAIGAGSNVFAGYLPEPAAREVFADPDQGNATMFAPVGTLDADGRSGVLSGRWPFTSNCLHSSWAGLGAFVRRHGGAPEPAPVVVFVPVADLEIENTWSARGLCGTGSHHVAAHSIAVDLQRSCRFTDAAWPAGTLWRLPIYTVLIPTLAAVPLGIARGAVDDVLALARQGRDARRGQLHDDPIGMAELAVADTDLRSVTALLRESLGEARSIVEQGGQVDRPLQARILLAGMRGCDVAVQATSVAHALGGGAAVYDGSRLLRALLDVHTGRQHMLFGHHHRAALAAAVAGRDVVYPPFLV